MSVYKMIECNRCGRKEILSEETLEWFVCCDAAEGFLIAKMRQHKFSAPDAFEREHFCAGCGGGILMAIKRIFNMEVQSK